MIKKMKRVIAFILMLSLIFAEVQITQILNVLAADEEERVIQLPSDIDCTWYNPTKMEAGLTGEKSFAINLTVNASTVPIYLSFPTDGGIRLHTEQEGMWKAEDVSAITYSNASGGYQLEAGNGTSVLFVSGTSGTASIKVYNSENEEVFALGCSELAFGYDGGELKKVKLENSVSSGEVFYGLGERYNSFDQTGSEVLLWNTDDFSNLASDSATSTSDFTKSYLNVPILHSSKGYTLFFNSTYSATADMGKTNSSRYSLDFSGPIFDFYLWTGTPLENIQAYTGLTGTSYLPAKWAFSYLAGSGQQVWDLDGTDSASHIQEVEDYVAGFENLGTPVSSLYFETSKVYDLKTYEAIKEKEIYPIAWTNSCIRPLGMEYEDLPGMDTLLPGIETTLLPYVYKKSNSTEKMDGPDAYLDFTNPLAKTAIYNKFLPLWNAGVRGCMVDYADNLYEDTLSYNGMTGDQMHNLYSYYYLKACYEAWNKQLDDDFLLFARSGSAGSQSYAANFAGDLSVTENGMRAALNSALSMSASGYSIWGSDIGGQGSSQRVEPTENIYIRWMQLGAFSPLMRTHGMSHRGPWTYGENSQAVTNYQKYYWLRENLVNYIYSAAIDSHLYGIPMMQSMAVAFPDETNLVSIDDQYMFGENLLVCPVMEENATSRKVTLPKGQWVDFWTGETVTGGQTLTVNADIYTIPVYVKSGAMLPLTVSNELELTKSLESGSVDALMVTTPQQTREQLYHTDTETHYNFTSSITNNGAYSYNVAEGSNAKVVYAMSITAEDVTVDGVQLKKLNAKPTSADAVGYYIDSANNRTIICTGGDWSSLTISVSSTGTPVKDVAIDFGASGALDEFTSYYAANAKNGFTAEAYSGHWDVKDGGIYHKLPSGVGGWWWSNNDQYASKGVGQLEYGIVSNLVYTAQEYTDFELEVDVKRTGSSITRPTAVGFGQTPGQFFVDSNNNMSSAGGAYAYINRNGETAVWGYLKNTVDGDGKLTANGRVKGTTISSNGTGADQWNHVKLIVRGQKAWMYVDNELVNTVDLLNYEGGYISLMTSGDGAFKNLIIRDGRTSIKRIEKVEECTNASQLPKQLEIVLETGTKMQADIAWNYPNEYLDGVNGIYEFTGTIVNLPSGVENTNGIVAKATVRFAEGTDEKDTVYFDFNNTEMLTRFTSYYAANAYNGFEKSAFADNWQVTNNGQLQRILPKGVEAWWCSNSDVYQQYGVGEKEYGIVANTLYNGRTYRNFVLEVDMRRVQYSISRSVCVGFGQTPGEFFVDSNGKMKTFGGTYFELQKNGEAGLWGYASGTVESSSGNMINARVKGATYTTNSDGWEHVKMKVANGYVSVYVNDTLVIDNVSLKNYHGGYISLLTSADGAFDNLKITSLDNEQSRENISEIPLTSTGDLFWFQNYYAKSAKTGLTSTKLAEDWTISDNGVARLATPHGIGGFWQSNVDGNGDYGYISELLYTRRSYKNFELTVDAMQVAEGISRVVGVGFGKKTPGKFFANTSNVMNVEGGAYAYVKCNSAETAIWGYTQDTVDGSAGTLVNDGRVIGDAVASGSTKGKWHTIKVRVEDGKASMWVKTQGEDDSKYQRVITDVQLKDYDGGYISLMTTADGAFKNLKIDDLDLYTVATISSLSDNSTTGIANLDGGTDGLLYGEQVKVTASSKDGYTFMGWYGAGNTGYDASTCLGNELTYKHNVTGDTKLYAVYQANANATVKVDGTNYSVTADGKDVVGTNQSYKVPIGTRLTLDASDNANFMYWKNAEGKVMSRNKAFTFAVTADTNIIMADNSNQSQAFVEFTSFYGQILQAGTFDNFTEADLPAEPSRRGYTFVRWDKSVADINAAISSGGKIEVRPVYTKDDERYTVTVQYQSGLNLENEIYSNKAIGESLTLKAPTVRGKLFSHWSSDQNGTTVLSYQKEYFVTVKGDMTLYPIYGDEMQEVRPAISVTDIFRTQINDKKKLSFEVTRNVPDNYEMIETGVLYSTDSGFANSEMVIGGTNVGRYVSSATKNVGVFTLNVNVTNNEDVIVYARGYVIVENPNTGNAETYYTDMAAAKYSVITRIALTSDEDLSNFTNYYAKHAKEGLQATALSEDWTISDNGVARLATPHGIGGFWQSNPDKDNTGEFGYVSELVYTKQQFTDFEVTVDAMQVAESIGRGVGVGFGKTELGTFFVDTENQMSAAGGAYAYVKRGGETAIWGYCANSVDSATGELTNDGRKSGTAVTGGSACSTWHTIKVRVEDSKVSMWVKAQGAEDTTYQQVVTDVALKDYAGGYISLMSNANGAFKNLKIEELLK